MISSSWACIDLETTGLDQRSDRIIEIGLVLVSPDREPLEESILVRADKAVSERITEITGITQKDVDSGVPIGEALDWLAERTAGAELWVGHNFLAFDLGFLMWESGRAGKHLVLPENGIEDTAVLFLAHRLGIARYQDEPSAEFAARVMHRRPRGMHYNLGYACMEMGVVLDQGQHRALADAILTQRLYAALLAFVQVVERPRMQAARW